MIVGQFIKRVAQLAKGVSPDHEAIWDREANAVMVTFPNESAVLVNLHEISTLVEGTMADTFNEVAHKEFQSSPALDSDKFPDPW